MTHNDLHSGSTKISWPQVVSQVAACLREIHAAGFVHGAVKPAHIVLHRAQNRWALVDFDRAAAAGAVKPPDPMLPYAPPEAVVAAVSGQHGVFVDPAQDAWALGVVTFELLTGREAFYDNAYGEQQVRLHVARPWLFLAFLASAQF